MILVTGGTGLVGSHLLYLLTQQNDTVKAIYRSEKSLEAVKKVFSYYTEEAGTLFSKIEWVLADITNICSLENAFESVTNVYHAAALVSFDPKEYRVMRQVNIDGTANVVNLCIDKKIQKLCFVSSIATLGEKTTSKEIDEDNEWSSEGNNSGYSITKHGAEMEVWRATQEGVDVVIVNPGVILGAGFWNTNTGKFFSQVDKGFRFYTKGVTGFIGVIDVVKIMLQLMNSNLKNERFVLVSENKSFKKVFSLIAESLEKKKPTIRVSKIITSLVWRVDFIISKITGKKSLLTKENAISLHTKTYYNSKKLQKQLGYTFQPINEVIKETSKYYRTTL